MPQEAARLLVIEDEPTIAEFIGDAVEEIGFVVKLTNSFDDFQAASLLVNDACIR